MMMVKMKKWMREVKQLMIIPRMDPMHKMKMSQRNQKLSKIKNTTTKICKTNKMLTKMIQKSKTNKMLKETNKIFKTKKMRSHPM